jgi:hypothetical protein
MPFGLSHVRHSSLTPSSEKGSRTTESRFLVVEDDVKYSCPVGLCARAVGLLLQLQTIM